MMRGVADQWAFARCPKGKANARQVCDRHPRAWYRFASRGGQKQQGFAFGSRIGTSLRKWSLRRSVRDSCVRCRLVRALGVRAAATSTRACADG